VGVSKIEKGRMGGERGLRRRKGKGGEEDERTTLRHKKKIYLMRRTQVLSLR
jgi:hypothetical protein